MEHINDIMPTAVDVAKIFIEKGLEDNIDVTQMKLQKLVYFAYGALLASSKGEKKLFNDEIQAWNFGPVIPSIYHEYKRFGASRITEKETIIEKVFSWKSTKTDITGEERSLIENVWNQLKELTAIQLSEWTHLSGSAWDKVFVADRKNVRLRDEDIIEDFKRILKP